MPIFRYWDDKYKFNVEINFNNEIGIRNTRLLYAYNTCKFYVILHIGRK